MERSSGRGPGLTLMFGGSGIVLGSLEPLWSRLILIVPPEESSWLSTTWPPELLETLSAAVLSIGFVILAIGIGREPGIAGSSILGRASLIVFAVCSFVPSLFAFAPMRALSAIDYAVEPLARTSSLTVTDAVETSLTVVGLAALVVASILVVRASVLHGVARWGLLVLAAVCVVTLIAQRTPIQATVMIEIARWGLISTPVIQLVLGALYIAQGQKMTARAPVRVLAE